VKHAYRYGGATVDLVYIGENRWLVTWIESKNRGQGEAQRVLDQVKQDADAEGVWLWLSIQPDPGVSWIRLSQWYSRNGFVHNRISDPNSMERLPELPQPRLRGLGFE
jgi:hypothetical protein